MERDLFSEGKAADPNDRYGVSRKDPARTAYAMRNVRRAGIGTAANRAGHALRLRNRNAPRQIKRTIRYVATV